MLKSCPTLQTAGGRTTNLNLHGKVSPSAPVFARRQNWQNLNEAQLAKCLDRGPLASLRRAVKMPLERHNCQTTRHVPSSLFAVWQTGAACTMPHHLYGAIPRKLLL